MTFLNYIFYRNTGLNNTDVSVISGPLDVTNLVTIRGYNIINPNDYPVYLKFFDSNTTNTTVGTTTPKGVLSIPANGSITEAGNINNAYLLFGTAVTIAATKFLSDSDNTSLTNSIYVELQLEKAQIQS